MRPNILKSYKKFYEDAKTCGLWRRATKNTWYKDYTQKYLDEWLLQWSEDEQKQIAGKSVGQQKHSSIIKNVKKMSSDEIRHLYEHLMVCEG